MNKNYFKIAAILLFIGAITISCGSRRNRSTSVVEGAVEIVVPFSGAAYQTSDTHWRGRGNGSSIELAMARNIAMQLARTELATSIQATVTAVTERYGDQRQVQDNQLFQSRLQEMGRTVVNQQLNDVRTLGERTFREPNGRIRVYVALEMSRDAVRNAMISSISADEMLRLDFDQHMFRRIFDEEMRNFQNR